MESITKYNEAIVEVSQETFERIKSIHEKVSKIKTPKGKIKKKMGFDYVEFGYMKQLANEHFPGWSWRIIETKVLGNFFMVHGRLIWNEANIVRVGDMIAAHRIQKSKDKDSFVDVGNDIKAANSDTMKKAFNTYMNICDDVYKNDDTRLSKEQEDELINLINEIGDDFLESELRTNISAIKLSMENEQINKTNFDAKMKSLRSYLEIKKESEREEVE